MKKIYLSISKQSNVGLIEYVKEKLTSIGVEFYFYQPVEGKRYDEDEVLTDADAIIVLPPDQSFNVDSKEVPEYVVVGKGNLGEAHWGLEHRINVYVCNQYDQLLHIVTAAKILDAKSFTKAGELYINNFIPISRLWNNHESSLQKD